MTSRGILYKPEMIRAKLEGRKTQTRRTNELKVINQNPNDWKFNWYDYQVGWCFNQISTLTDERIKNRTFNQEVIKCPYGIVRDLLYAKEAIGYERIYPNAIEEPNCSAKRAIYKLDKQPHVAKLMKWTSPLFMPRAAARIIDEITGIRVERVQDISAEDVIAEGVAYIAHINGTGEAAEVVAKAALKWAYRELWIKINGQESWDSNLWVWVIETKNLTIHGWDGIKK